MCQYCASVIDETDAFLCKNTDGWLMLVILKVLWPKSAISNMAYTC